MDFNDVNVSPNIRGRKLYVVGVVHQIVCSTIKGGTTRNQIRSNEKLFVHQL